MYPFDLHVQFALDRSRRYEQLATEHRAITTADAEASAYAAPGPRLSPRLTSRTSTIRDPASPAAA